MMTSLSHLPIPFRFLAVLSLLSLVRGAAADDRAGGPLQVTIERAPFLVRDPASYDIPLKVRAHREVRLVALVDGVVQPYRIKPGDKLTSQTELLRLDARARQLDVDRAAAALEAAEQEAEKGGVPARVKVAKAELALAQLRLEQVVTRMPWDGTVFDIHVTEGQFVRAGDPLATVIDATRLIVEIPVERKSARVGEMVELKVEDVTVEGVLKSVRPLDERLDPLRGLFESITGAIVEIDNADGRFLPGQTAYSSLIPRQPVGEVPVASISNSDEGERQVQVIRDGVIRNLPVQLLGQTGETHVWISGRFGRDDELILRTSEPLPDGTLVTPKSLVDAKGLPRSPAGNPRSTLPRSNANDDF